MGRFLRNTMLPIANPLTFNFSALPSRHHPDQQRHRGKRHQRNHNPLGELGDQAGRQAAARPASICQNQIERTKPKSELCPFFLRGSCKVAESTVSIVNYLNDDHFQETFEFQALSFEKF